MAIILHSHLGLCVSGEASPSLLFMLTGWINREFRRYELDCLCFSLLSPFLPSLSIFPLLYLSSPTLSLSPLPIPLSSPQTLSPSLSYHPFSLLSSPPPFSPLCSYPLFFPSLLSSFPIPPLVSCSLRFFPLLYPSLLSFPFHSSSLLP